MENAKKISVKDAPKGFKLLLILLPAVGYFLITLTLDNDFYFLYPTGEYIVNNGFPFKDFLSMHSNMDIIVQQWLIDVVFYELYSKLGAIGIAAFIALCYTALMVLMYKLCYLISDNWFTSAICAFIADIFICGIYMTSRPQALTFVLLALELFALESYVKTKKAAYLVIIPAVSLVLINAHASMWLMLFVLALPYAAESIPIKLKKFEQKPCCSFWALLITGIISFAVGFINPYGIKAMTYIFTSFGYKEINGLVFEMQPTKPTNTFGILFYIIILIIAVVTVLTRYKNFRTRFVLLFTGTLVLSIMNYKSVGLFIIVAMAAYSYYLKDLEFSVTVKESKRTKKEKMRIAILAILIVITSVGAVFAVINNNTNTTELSEYESLDKVVEILNGEKEEIILFAGFDYGQYLEFRGYHPYLDGRAELFLKDNNHEYDYLKEYYNLVTGSLDVGEFTKRYGFTHLAVNKNETELYNGLLNSSDYSLIYKDSNIYLFRQKSLDNAK